MFSDAKLLIKSKDRAEIVKRYGLDKHTASAYPIALGSN
jgi:hypothetical protein